MITTALLLIWVLYIGFDVWVNHRIIEINQARPNYLLLNIMRGGAFILYGAYMWDFQYEIWYFNILVYCTTSFWVLFDLVLNVLRGKHPLYIGMHSGWIDQFGFRHQGIYYLAKVIALVWLVFSVINIYQP